MGEEVAVLENYINKKILEKKSLNLGSVDIIRTELLNTYKKKGLISKKYNYVFTDKSLNNFFYLKIIKAIYPSAKIIHCKRNQFDTCISCFKKDFTGDYRFTYDLNELVNFYNLYEKLMKFWAKKDPVSNYEAFLSKEGVLSAKVMNKVRDEIASEIDALSNQLNQVQSLYDRQLAQITDLYRTQASLAAVQSEQLQLETDLALRQEFLRTVSGIDVGELFRLDSVAEIPTLENSVQFYVQQSRERNQQILAREYALQAAQERISEAKGAYMPQVTFIAARQDSDVGFDNLPINRTDNTYIGLDVSIPLFAGGSNRAAVSEAVSRRSIAENELLSIRLAAGERVRSAFLQVQSSETRTEAARRLVESTALSAEAMQQGFDLGTVTSVDVLDALRDRYQAERDLQRTRYEHIKFLLLLKRETGTLEAEDMLEVGSWLIPPDA